MSVKARLARLEANLPPDPSARQVVFLWASDADNPAMAAAEARANAEGREFMLIKLVAPEMDANGKAITTRGAANG